MNQNVYRMAFLLHSELYNNQIHHYIPYMSNCLLYNLSVCDLSVVLIVLGSKLMVFGHLIVPKDLLSVCRINPNQYSHHYRTKMETLLSGQYRRFSPGEMILVLMLEAHIRVY